MEEKMDKLAWRDDLATGFGDIDADHKSLFDYLDVLETAVKDERGHEMSKGVLGGLVEYARHHFAREEAIFTKHEAYTISALHVQEHRQFVAEIEKFGELLAADIDISADMVAFLSKWLVRHIMTVDKVFFDSVQKRPANR
jgi:hemerythrin-like metal-binding protein